MFGITVDGVGRISKDDFGHIVLFHDKYLIYMCINFPVFEPRNGEIILDLIL